MAAALLKQSRIGFAGGRRVSIEDMAGDKKSQQDLEELLEVMEAMEAEKDVSCEAPAAASPEPKSKHR